MNLNIYLEDQLGKELIHFAAMNGKTKNFIIREALRDWLHHHKTYEWPCEIMQFKGMGSFSAFEDYRDNLLPVSDDPLT